MLWDLEEDKRYAGHMDQLFKVNRVEMLDGRAEGAKLLDVQKWFRNEFFH